jgi:Family of unknown function (DUF5989)
LRKVDLVINVPRVTSLAKYWLWPVFAMMAALGVLIVLAQGSAVAPFIYTLF